MRGRTTASLSVALGLWVGLAAGRADDGGWSPVSAPPAVARARAVIATTRPAAAIGRPVAAIGRPVPLAAAAEPAAPAPTALRPTVRAQAPDAVAPPAPAVGVPPPPGGNEFYNNGVVTAPGTGFLDRSWGFLKDSCTRKGGQLFQSDHGGDLDQFSSPVTSPFLTEDPRALTEVRPIFLYQTVPGENPVFRGGNIEFFGLSARLALTERWSIVLNKLGGIAFQPDDTTFLNDETSFSEVWVGPKFTFYRDDCHNTVAAAGITFQIPVGNDRLFQDTGDLSIAPYLSFAKSFGRIPNGFGSFNFMSTTGFAVGTDDLRSDYFYSNFHIDFDVAGQHRFYPMVELNWTRYLSDGGRVPFNFEGGDLINFGATNVSGRNLVTLATGARYKFSEYVQVGGAFEFPLTDQKDLLDFRFTLDLILRY